MTTLFLIWGISGAIAIVLLAVAWKKDSAMNFTAFPSATLSNIVWEEVLLGMRVIMKALSVSRPHAQNLLYIGSRTLSRGHDIFMTRIYGKIKIEKGITPSFFLKQIAEHRDERRGDADRSA